MRKCHSIPCFQLQYQQGLDEFKEKIKGNDEKVVDTLPAYIYLIYD